MVKKCEHCGAMIAANADVCYHCHRKVYNAFAKNWSTPTPKSKFGRPDRGKFDYYK